MNYHHRYKPRDFRVAQLLVTLRKKASLTQEELALRMDVTAKAIGNWEGGSNYPTERNLRKLIELYLDNNVFAPGQERDEVRELWEQLREGIPRRIGLFDERWFAALLTQRQARRIDHAYQLQGSPPHVPALYGRTDELAELERWLLVDQCRMMAVLGVGGIGKTTLVVKFVQLVAPHFECVLWRSLHNAPSL